MVEVKVKVKVKVKRSPYKPITGKEGFGRFRFPDL
jgi:hypothetical protein